MTRPSAPRLADLQRRLGERLAGRFRLEKVLGAGGMGWVYLAIQEPLGRPVAVKILSRTLDVELFRQRFFREASIAARLSSPHIVTVHDYGETDEGELFIAMEYVRGVPLSLVLRREGPFAPERVCRLTRQVCKGLGVAHDAGAIHRDLKPSNLMLLNNRKGEEVVKILDFGLVKSLTDEPEDGELTGAGAVLGSPNYMSPEQIRRKGVDPRTDVYAMGAIIYRLLTGKLPFEAETVVETMNMHLNSTPPSIDTHVEDPDFAARQLEAIALRCLEKQPDLRYSSMDELDAALEGVQRMMAVTTVGSISVSDVREVTPSLELSDVPSTPTGLPLAVDPVIEDSPTQVRDEASPPSSTAPAPPTGKKGPVVAAAVVGLAIAAGAALMLNRPGADAPAGATPEPPSRTAAAPPAPAPEPAQVELRIFSKPEQATVHLGDTLLGKTPLTTKVPVADGLYQLRLERPGHRSVTKEIRLDGPTVEMSLVLPVVRRAPRRSRKPPPPKVAPSANPLRDKLKSNPYD